MARRREQTLAHCNRCGGETKHFVLFRHEETGEVQLAPEDPEVSYTWTAVWEVLECCGCEKVELRREYTEMGQTESEYFPARVSRDRPVWVDNLPDGITQVLDEVYAALHANTRRLAMMGARCLIDMVMLDTVLDIGGFSEKLAAMEEDGLIGSRNREYLEAALDAGNAVIHRGHHPDVSEVGIVMDIVESLLQTVYVLGQAGDELKQMTPPRPPRAKRGAKTK